VRGFHPGLQLRGAIPLQLQENANAAIKILLAVSDLPTIQEHSQFLLRVPNGGSCHWPILFQPYKRLKRCSNLGLHAPPRGSRISYPPRRDVRSEFEKAADGRASARRKQFSFSRHKLNLEPLKNSPQVPNAARGPDQRGLPRAQAAPQIGPK